MKEEPAMVPFFGLIQSGFPNSNNVNKQYPFDNF